MYSSYATTDYYIHCTTTNYKPALWYSVSTTVWCCGMYLGHSIVFVLAAAGDMYRYLCSTVCLLMLTGSALPADRSCADRDINVEGIGCV